MSQWCAFFRYSGGVNLRSFRSTSSGSLPGAIPVRLETLKMCIDRYGRLPERRVQDHVRSLAPHARQCLEGFAILRHGAAVSSSRICESAITFFAFMR